MAEGGAGARIAVIGAGGILGSFLVKSLRERGYSVLRVLRRPDGDRQARVVDLREREQVLAVARACDLVISVVRESDLIPERAILAAGGKLMSVASLTLHDRRELVAYAQANRGGTVVVHAGLNPGVSSVLLKELLRREPRADAAEIVLTLSGSGTHGRHGMSSAGIPMMKARRRHPTTTVELAAPFGRRRAIAVSDGQEGFFGEVGGELDRRVYWCFAEHSTQRTLHAINRLGALRAVPDRLLLAGHHKPPRELSREPKRDLVALTLGGRVLRAMSIEGQGDYAMTVTASTAMAELLLDDDAAAAGLQAQGCFGAEEIFAYEQLHAVLRERGIVVRECVGAVS